MFFSTSNFVAQVVLSLLLSSVVSALNCNGHSELCNRSYGNITFVGAHNSYAVGTDSLAINQDQDVTQQLNDGIRMLQMQVHNKDGVIQLCHTSCSLYNGGTLADYLTKVQSWMKSNPNDVLSLLIVNSDNFTPIQFDSAFKTAGLDTISYAPPSASVAATAWPTLGDMISQNHRLVTFLDAGADFTSVPYIIDEFTNIWETAFDVTDTRFDCAVNRTKGPGSPTQMYLINHFLDQIVLGQPAPDVEQANVTNSASGVGSLQAQVDTCVADYAVNPNFMLVDFYEFGGGSVFQVAANLNGVTYNPQTPIATPMQTGSGTVVTSVPLSAASSLWSSLSGGHWVAALSVIASVMLIISGVA